INISLYLHDALPIFITEGGVYELVVTDDAGNETALSFIIDRIEPIITGVEDSVSYNGDVTVSFNKGTATLNGELFTSGTTIVTRSEEHTSELQSREK